MNRKSPMTFFEAKILISAPPGKVWDVLVDFKNYHLWNPFVPKMEATKSVGSPLLLYVKLNKNQRILRKQKEILLAFEPHKALCWGMEMINPFIFNAHRWQLLHSREDGKSCEYHTYELFEGKLARFMGACFGKNVQAGFEATAEALKRYIEE